MGNDDQDIVSIIAAALRTKFGDGAIDVARFQVNEAANESLAVWQAVVRELSMH